MRQEARRIGSDLLDRGRRALGIGNAPVDSDQAFWQWSNWGFVIVATMLLAALMAGAYVALLPQAPWWLSVIAWFVWMAGPVYAGTKMVKAYFRYLQLRTRERRGR